jgi:hypothetical protein
MISQPGRVGFRCALEKFKSIAVLNIFPTPDLSKDIILEHWLIQSHFFGD